MSLVALEHALAQIVAAAVPELAVRAVNMPGDREVDNATGLVLVECDAAGYGPPQLNQQSRRVGFTVRLLVVDESETRRGSVAVYADQVRTALYGAHIENYGSPYILREHYEIPDPDQPALVPYLMEFELQGAYIPLASELEVSLLPLNPPDYIIDLLAQYFPRRSEVEEGYQEHLSVSVPGQTQFTLANASAQPGNSKLYVNGVRARYGGTYTINGTVLTWLNPYVLDVNDSLTLNYS